MVRYSKKLGKRGKVNRKNQSRKRGKKSGKSLRRSRLLKAERKRKRKSRKPKMRGGVLEIPTQLKLFKFIYGMYIYSELIKYETCLTELNMEKISKIPEPASLKRISEINKLILSQQTHFKNLNTNYKAIKSLKEDDNSEIMEKIIDRTLYVRAKSFAAANQEQERIKKIQAAKQKTMAAGLDSVDQAALGVERATGIVGGGGQRGGSGLDSGPAVAGHWPYREVRHFINLCNNFIELESWLKRCQVPSFGKRKSIDSGPKSTLFAQAKQNMSEDAIADSILKEREKQRKEHYNQAPDEYSGRLREIEEIKEGRSEVKNAIISSENIFKVIQSKVKAILMLTGLSTKAHDLTKTSALSFFSKKSSSVVGNVKNIKQMLLPFTEQFEGPLEYKDYMSALYPEDSAQPNLPKPPSGIKLPKKKAEAHNAFEGYTVPKSFERPGLKPKLQSLVPFSGHPESLYAKPSVTKEEVIADWGTAVAAAKAAAEEQRRKKGLAANTKAAQDTTDFIEEQRQIANAKHIRETKTQNIINSLTLAEMFPDKDIKEFLDGLNDLFFLDDEQTIQEIVINHYLEFDGAEAEVLQNTVISAAEAAVTAAVTTPRPRPVPRPRPRPKPAAPADDAEAAAGVHTFSSEPLSDAEATTLKQSPGFISFLHDDSTHGAEINDLDYGFRDVQIEIPANAKPALPKQSHIAFMRHKLSSSYLPEGQEELNIGAEVLVKSWDSDFAVLESGVSIPTSYLDIMHPVGLLDCDWDA